MVVLVITGTISQILHLGPKIRNKDTTLYTYLMIHFYLLQNNQMKESALSKSSAPKKTNFISQTNFS